MRDRMGHVQRGWQATDEDILYGFIRALRRGDYDEALRLAPTEARMADWPAGQRADWRAWIDLAHRMQGQRDHERRARAKAGRRARAAGHPRRVPLGPSKAFELAGDKGRWRIGR